MTGSEFMKWTSSGMTSDSAMSRKDTAAMLLSWSTLHTALMVTAAITVATEVKPIIVCFRISCQMIPIEEPILP